MPELFPMPSIGVSIGGQHRIYHAYVTTAGPDLDGPSTLTLYASSFADVAGLAADPIVHDAARATVAARLVLIETRELDWHRRNYRAEQRLFKPVDPILVNLTTLQRWLWQRLQSPAATEVHA